MSRHRALGTYLAGALTARAGDEMSGPALLLAGYAVAGSAAHASALLAGVTGTAAIGGPLLGVLLDRTRRPGRLLALALSSYAVGLVVVLATLGRVPLGLSVLLAMLIGLAGPAIAGGWTAQLPRVVSAERLPRANALDAMTFSTATLLGPALAGGVAEFLDAPAAVVVAAALVGLAAPIAWIGTPARWDRRDRRPERPAVWADLMDGLGYVLSNPSLARATFASAVSFVAVGMTTACLPLLGERVLGSPGRGAWLLSCAAVAALAANGALARRPTALGPDTVLWISTSVQAGAVAALAVGHPIVAVAGAVILGIGEGPQLTALFAVRHREAIERLRTQIFTTGASLKISAFAVGAAVAGPVAEWSLPWTLSIAAGIQVLAAALFLRASVARRQERLLADVTTE